ncbi:MAG TPA: GNAT family N-acetyltransferase [Xanthobacteraceae bacterium]|nr:GNAT family N-acetyltransferase [Xanthobacteraceae bacterium]
MPILRPARDADLPGILAIHNDAVRNTTAIWNETPSDLAGRAAWLDERRGRGFPVLVAEEDARVLGYSSFGDFRPHEGYRISVEHSVYVAASARARGLGRALVEALFAPARAMDKKVMIGGITADNAASIALHERLGFTVSGRMPGIGIKFGRRLDLVLMQKDL